MNENTKDEHGLSQRQRRLADYYVRGMKPSRAALAAGYSPNSVRSPVNVLTTPAMADYIREERRRQAEDERMGREELVGWLTRVIRHEVPGHGVDADVVELETREFCKTTRRWKRQRVVNKLEASKRLAKIMGWDKGGSGEEGEDRSLEEFERELKTQDLKT